MCRSRGVLVFATSLVVIGFLAGCDRANQTKPAPQAGATTNGQRQSELPLGAAYYPPTPELVVAAARQAATEGRWSLYYAFLTPESVEKLAKSYVQAAATDQPPSHVRDQAKARERIACIKLVLHEKRVDTAEVEAARDDPAAQMRIVRKFGSPQEFVTAVTGRFEPNGDRDLLPIRSAQWSIEGDTASGMFLGPEGEQRFLTLKKIDGQWKVER